MGDGLDAGELNLLRVESLFTVLSALSHTLSRILINAPDSTL